MSNKERCLISSYNSIFIANVNIKSIYYFTTGHMVIHESLSVFVSRRFPRIMIDLYLKEVSAMKAIPLWIVDILLMLVILLCLILRGEVMVIVSRCSW